MDNQITLDLSNLNVIGKTIVVNVLMAGSVVQYYILGTIHTWVQFKMWRRCIYTWPIFWTYRFSGVSRWFTHMTVVHIESLGWVTSVCIKGGVWVTAWKENCKGRRGLEGYLFWKTISLWWVRDVYRIESIGSYWYHKNLYWYRIKMTDK